MTDSLKHVSEKPWSDYTKADYSIEQWHAACLIHLHQGPPTSKDQCKIPVRTPNGAVNRNGVHAAAAALAGARGGVQAPPVKLAAARAALSKLYGQLNEQAPPSLSQASINAGAEFLEHYGVKGMHWGVRRGESLEPRTGGFRRRRPAQPGRQTNTQSSTSSSDDAARAAAYRQRAATSGTHSLSNQELQHLVNRMNLEQNYSRLVSGKDETGNKVVKAGSGLIGEILKNVGKQLATEVLKSHGVAQLKKKGFIATTK